MTGSEPAPRSGTRAALVLVSLVVLVLAACVGGDGDDAILVFAAASLADAFTELEASFESTSGIDVHMNLAGTSSLVAQLEAGAPADVFASARTREVEDLVAAGLVESAEPFATNEMVIATPAGNPGDVVGLESFALQALEIGVCAVEVPCGAFAAEVFGAAGVDARPDTEEPNVRALLTKIVDGELDAGIVYRSDVVANGDVEVIDIPQRWNVSTTYPIGVLVRSERSDAANRFVEFVRSTEGRRILRRHGFGTP